MEDYQNLVDSVAQQFLSDRLLEFGAIQKFDFVTALNYSEVEAAILNEIQDYSLELPEKSTYFLGGVDFERSEEYCFCEVPQDRDRFH